MNILFYANIESVHIFCSLFLTRTLGIESGEIQAIHWIYPILGLPQALHSKCPQGRYAVESQNTKIPSDLRGSFNPVSSGTSKRTEVQRK